MNTSGERVSEELAHWETLLADFRSNPRTAQLPNENLLGFVEDGRDLREWLQAIVHGKMGPGDPDPGDRYQKMRQWLRFSRSSRSELGAHAVGSGLDLERPLAAEESEPGP